MRCVRFDSQSVLGSKINLTNWGSKADSTSVGLCFFPVEEVRNYADDIEDLSQLLSRDLGHACNVCLVADVTPDKKSVGRYNFADGDYIREVSVYSWDNVKVVTEIAAKEGLSWSEVTSL